MTEILLGLLCSTGQLTADNDHGRKIVEPPKHLLIALWFLATPECYRSVSNCFGVTLSTTHKTVRRVKSALMALQDQFIQWPTGNKWLKGYVSCSSSLMTPYRDTGHLTPVEKKYNARHSSTRSLIECSFGLLNEKWRKLQYMDVLGIPDACNFVYAACILHNVLLASDGIEDGALLPQDIDDCAPALAEESVGNAAHTKRNNIAALL
ncbi:uncharacterized protein [Argopecten irradians]|uniref:uncharacterized protein n=1 Tax=Argopecten irradians TaxID=31199 RepID=UPI00371FB258